MLFIIEDDNVLANCDEIWEKIKELIGKKIHGKPTYGNKYIKTDVRSFNGTIHTTFWGNEIPNKGIHYTCLVVDSVMNINNKH